MNRYRVLNAIARFPLKGTGLLVRALRKVWLPALKPGMVITTLQGYRMEIDPVNDVGLERELYYHGTYESGTLQLMEQLLPPGGTFVDAGANIGLMTLHAAQIVGRTGRVLAFEPQPTTHDILQRNVALNGFSWTAVHALALGETAGTATIYAREHVGRGGSSLYAPEAQASGVEVEVDTLDNKITGPVDLLKVDVEGHEVPVLEGARQLLSGAHPPAVIVECSSGTAGNRMAILALFAQLPHYAPFRHITWKGNLGPLRPIHDEQDLPEHDNIVFLTATQRMRLGALIQEDK